MKKIDIGINYGSYICKELGLSIQNSGLYDQDIHQEILAVGLNFDDFYFLRQSNSYTNNQGYMWISIDNTFDNEFKIFETIEEALEYMHTEYNNPFYVFDSFNEMAEWIRKD